MNTAELYNEYKTKMQKIADVKYASAVLQWDQETYLPSKGAFFRGKQIATLTAIAHETFTDDKFETLLQKLIQSKELTIQEKANVTLTLNDYKRSKKLPNHFVKKMSETVNQAFHAWIDARKKNSFAVFQPVLQDLINLKIQETDLLGYEQHPYDALMDEYDKGLNVSKLDLLFNNLLPALTILIGKIKSKTQVNNSVLNKFYDKDNQWKLSTELLKQIGFDWEAGRQDVSEHPFTTNFNNTDVRVTIQIDENDLSNAAFTCLHEGGHALYEQGLPEEQYGLPLGEYCSLSIHESQSRLWENCVGRSKAFWQHNFTIAQSLFPSQLAETNLEQFYKAINKVQPSLIRTDADELTYHFHVYIRYEIEKELIKGNLSARDIPTFWNDLYKKYLGVTVLNDKKGCLQDVHWSHGSFGYFPTYSLGSLYAAQFYFTMIKENPSIETEMAQGNVLPILSWLRNKIHQHGRLYTSDDICKAATGESLSSEYFLEYTNQKFNAIYSN